VTEVERDSTGYKLIALAPAVDFSSLEELLVVQDRPQSADGEGAE
jgi:hypothetical protein